MRACCSRRQRKSSDLIWWRHYDQARPTLYLRVFAGRGRRYFTGTVRPDATVFIQTSAAATCVGDDGNQTRMQDVTRTVTFPWGWRF